MNGKTIFLFLMFLVPLLRKGTDYEVSAQDTIDNSIQQKLENLAENSQNEEDDYTPLLESLNYYKIHPINLNNANPAVLAELELLNEVQIVNLLDHIDKNKNLLTIYELQSIDGFDLQTIETILPYVKVTDITENLRLSFKEIMKQGNHEITLRGQQVLEKQKGFFPIDSTELSDNPNLRYIGSLQKIYSRYRFTYGNNVSFGITGEKDPGELFFKKNNPHDYPYYDSLLNGKQKNGFDFYSAHFYLKNAGKIKALAIGDYQVGFGQGLTAWSGLAYGRSADAVNIKKYPSGIRPYNSVDENRFMRGVALSSGFKNIFATAFFSKKKIDANVSTADSILTITSLQQTGLHTTPSEIADKDAITQTALGGNISYRKRKYSLGLTGMHTLLDLALNRSPQPYNQFEFSGKTLTTIGADYTFIIHNYNFFGELAASKASLKEGFRGAGVSFLNGCIISLDPKISFSVLHRSFGRNSQSLFANAFAENSMPANEHGLYFGINIKPIHSISINAYYDHFSFPWLKYQTSAPSYGNEYLVQLNYAPAKRFDTYLRVRQKNKFVNSSSESEIDIIAPFNQTNYRWHMAYQITPSVKLRNRVELISVNNTAGSKEEGYMMYQDLMWKKIGSNVSITLRYALFDSKSFDSRIYTYETDVPGSYSIPSYYYKGSRTYVMLHYNISRGIELWLRWSQTYYSNKNVISEGTLNEIQGNSKSEVKVQAKLKF